MCPSQIFSALIVIMEMWTKILARLKGGTSVCDAILGPVAALASQLERIRYPLDSGWHLGT